MPDEIHQVMAIVRNPTPNPADDYGQVTRGFYTLNEGLMTMADGDRHANSQTKRGFLHLSQDSENRNAIAKTMTTEVYRFVHGLTQEHTSPTGFNRVFNYPSSGVA